MAPQNFGKWGHENIVDYSKHNVYNNKHCYEAHKLTAACRAPFAMHREPFFMQRHIIHFHIPFFPISVARVCSPALRDRPVAVAS